MAYARIGKHQLYFQVEGRADGPWLMFCNSLGTTHSMWDAQVPAFASAFRVLRYDRRGHGQSEMPPAPYSLDALVADALAVMDAAGATRVNFCGLSIGGLVGQALALRSPERLARLAVASTAAKIGTPEGWRARIEQVQSKGLVEVADAALERWFSPEFLERAPDVRAELRAQILATAPEGYIGCCHALAQADLRSQLARIRMPVLTLAGTGDPVTPPPDLQTIAKGVADGRAVEISGRHLCNIESADRFNGALAQFLGKGD